MDKESREKLRELRERHKQSWKDELKKVREIRVVWKEVIELAKQPKERSDMMRAKIAEVKEKLSILEKMAEELAVLEADKNRASDEYFGFARDSRSKK